MALHCPHCGTEIPSENINIQGMVALCSDCNHVFNFKDHCSAAEILEHPIVEYHNCREARRNEQETAHIHGAIQV